MEATKKGRKGQSNQEMSTSQHTAKEALPEETSYTSLLQSVIQCPANLLM